MSMVSRTAYSTWTPQKPILFDGHYLRNRSTLDIGVLGYIGIVQHKEHSRSFVKSSWDTLYISVYLHFSMMMEVEVHFETMISFHQTSRHHVPEYSNPSETLKSKKFLDISASTFGPTALGRLLWGSFWHLSTVYQHQTHGQKVPSEQTKWYQNRVSSNRTNTPLLCTSPA